MMGMFLALAAGAALSTTAPAEGALQSVSVPYADLDLATPTGRHALDARIHAAAAEICGLHDYDQQLPQIPEVMACAAGIAHDVHPVVATTIAQAVSGHASIMAASSLIGK